MKRIPSLFHLPICGHILHMMAVAILGVSVAKNLDVRFFTPPHYGWIAKGRKFLFGSDGKSWLVGIIPYVYLQCKNFDFCMELGL